MQETITALLVHEGEAFFQVLESILGKQGIKTRWARSCAEAFAALVQLDLPKLVFTGTTFCDGTWTDVLNLASDLKVHDATKIVVVSRVVDHRLYIDAIEKGAFDFIVPPFEPENLAFIVRSAICRAQKTGSQQGA
jgi:DNA-binding NtrC family response regulator